MSSDLENLVLLTPRLVIGYRLDSLPDVTCVQDLNDPS